MVQSRLGSNMVQSRLGSNMVQSRLGSNMVQSRLGSNMVQSRLGSNMVQSRLYLCGHSSITTAEEVLSCTDTTEAWLKQAFSYHSELASFFEGTEHSNPVSGIDMCVLEQNFYSGFLQQ